MTKKTAFSLHQFNGSNSIGSRIGAQKKIIILNFLKKGEIREYKIVFSGIEFDVKDYCIGWDYVQAAQILERYDGEVDGIILAGVREYASFGQTEVVFRKTRDLMRRAIKSSVYVGTDLQSLFANWTIRRAEKSSPGLFLNKNILFHLAVFTPYSKTLAEMSGHIFGSDTLLLGIPQLLSGTSKIERFLKLTAPLISKNTYYNVDITKSFLTTDGESRIQKWIRTSDIFVTYSSLMKTFEKFSCFKDKVVLIDSAPQSLKDKFIAAGVSQIIEFMPDMSPLTNSAIPSFALLNALIDQTRISTQPELSIQEFTLELIEKHNVQPKKGIMISPPLRRCSFVIHPLSVNQALSGSGLGVLKKAPEGLKKLAEHALAFVPVFPHGQVLGAKSELTGQEVVCDMYALAATPSALMKMDEERLYQQLVKTAQMAKEKGSLMMGLGAYTKVAGDAGVTVARRASLPITTGNSYSAAATLWAARVVVEKMQGLRTSESEPLVRHDAKAMVIGATGSIGRVSSLLLAESFKELVLVATRPDKLLELRDEILDSYPEVKISIATSPNSELPTTDLIVTATSSRGQRILDMMKVKPGAVICDCSRPLDISAEDAAQRPDVMVIESGEIDLPGQVTITENIGLPKPSVYACLAETVLLTMEGRYESFSLSRTLSLDRVKEIYRIGRKHGAKLSAIHGYNGVVTDEMIKQCKALADEELKNWPNPAQTGVKNVP